jgi:hypothetical protein
VAEPDVLTPVEQPRPVDDGLVVVLEPRGLGDRLVDDGFEGAIGGGSQSDPLPGGGSVDKVNICCRVSNTRTERFNSRAARTARKTWYWGRSPAPKAPPTKGETTRRSLFE